MKKYRPFLISIFIHLLIFLPWFLYQKSPQPLPGGGGGTGFNGGSVNVEMVGPASEGNQRVTRVQPQNTGDIPLVKETKKTFDKLRQSPEKSGGISGPVGPGTGSGRGAGSGEVSGEDMTLATIRSRIERSKRYPELAKNAGISGSVLVAFRIDVSGQAQDLTIKQSSGFSLLDEEATATILRAQPFPLYSEPLEIRIKFEQVSD